jgi:D-aminopeptidase
MRVSLLWNFDTRLIQETEVSVEKLRARDLGLQFLGTPGPFNAITDVPGIEVGYTTLRSGGGISGEPQVCTGVTAVLPRGRQPIPLPVWAGQFSFNGNGEMTGSHWVRDAGYFQGPVCLTNTHSVGIVHHAAVGWMIETYAAEYRDAHEWAMPVVAETYDGMTNDINGRHVTEQHALAALANARSGLVAEGNVGGGTGMQTYEFKGGTGTSSRRVAIAGQRHTIGVLVQSNFGMRPELKILGTPVGRHLADNAIFAHADLPETGSIIVLIATDIPLSPTQLRRLAKRGALGLARTGTSGGHYSGDLMLAFSTANPTYLPPLGAAQPHSFGGVWLNDAHCDAVYAPTVDAVEEAIINALIAAESVPTIKPPGRVLAAIGHQQLLDVMRAYGPPEALSAR